MAKWVMADNSIEIEQELEKVPVSILRIMKRRGVLEEDFEDFLSEKPKHTYDPFLLPDLKDACIEILHACNEGKRICVYGDYDADGVTSTTLMVSLLKRFSNNVRYFIPSRFNDGYGPNKNAFDSIAADGVDVIITVDCGITSRDEIEYAKSLGIKCIVTDHHILRDGMTPDCLVINPHRSDSSYPFKDLSGCGVAFKFAQGIERLLSENPSLAGGSFTKSDLNDLLDLVAISTVADIVPLLDENRNLVKYGLNRINQTKRAGLIALIKALDLSGEINALSISYVIAPNINALGRMGAADNGVELLESNKKYSELEKLAFDVAETNRQRKSVQEKTANLCKQVLSQDDCGEFAPVIYAPGAHEGVAGIVAGGLKEELGKPVCIVSPSKDGSLKGTGRSISGLNLHELFESCGDVFERFGGHAGACGFTVKDGCLEEFRQRLQDLVKIKANENPSILEKTIYIEKELSRDEMTLDFAECLKQLEPFGEANPVPIFCIRNAIVSDVRFLGSDGQHIRFSARANGKSIVCIAFGKSSDFAPILRSGVVDIAGELCINEFRGNKQLQMRVADLKAV